MYKNEYYSKESEIFHESRMYGEKKCTLKTGNKRMEKRGE